MARQVLVFLLLTIPALGFGATTLFKSPQGYSSGGANAISVAVGDLNGDGKPDIVVANGCILCGTDAVFGVGVLLGNGDGTFQTAHNYPVGDLVPISVAIGDVNRDGKPDVVVTSACFSDNNCAGVSLLLGNGDGSLQTAVTYDSGGMSPRGIALADVNGDGNLDLLVTNCAPSGSSSCYFGSQGNVAVLLGNGNGTFQAAKTFGSGGVYAWSIAVRDVNGDGKLDIVVLNCADSGRCESSDAGVGVLLGNGDGTFLSVVHYELLDAAAGGISVADVNGDGNPDIEVANGQVGVLLGNGDGSFQAEQTYNSGGSGSDAVAVADVNIDGKPDLVVANYFCGSDYNCSHGSIGVLLGNGDGTFQQTVTYASGGYGAFALAMADLNADFNPDILIANNCATGGECSTGVIGVLLNNTPVCRTPPVITVSVTPTFLWPPNGKMVPVVVSGTITDNVCTVTTAAYAVADEYGKVQPSGPVTLGAGGSYSFTVLLQASRVGMDSDGRVYTLTVRAEANAGNFASKTSVVRVPHDRGN